MGPIPCCFNSEAIRASLDLPKVEALDGEGEAVTLSKPWRLYCFSTSSRDGSNFLPPLTETVVPSVVVFVLSLSIAKAMIYKYINHKFLHKIFYLSHLLY